MISVYVGKPGAGKSYSAVIRLLESVVAGRAVYTNLPVVASAVSYWRVSRGRRRSRKERMRGLVETYNWRAAGRQPRFASVGPDNLFVHDTPDFHSVDRWESILQNAQVSPAGEGPVLIIDEFGSIIGNIANQDKTQVQGARKDNLLRLMKCLREHRHYYATIIFICQSHHQLDAVREVKALVEQWCEVKNYRHTTGLTYFTRTVFDEHFGSGREPISTWTARFNPAVFACYRSHDLAQNVNVREVGEEREVTTGGTRRWRLFVYLGFTAAALTGLLFFGNDFVDQVFGLLESKERVVFEGSPGAADEVVSAGAAALPGYQSDAAVPTGLSQIKERFPGLQFTQVNVVDGAYFEAGLWKVPRDDDACRLLEVHGEGHFLACQSSNVP